ncbi:hypothetical protein VU04_08990, partial [Desulfobulbus sp. TB]|nr:hypothetical protein [Desulfobulbus sp. TB]
MNKQRYLIKRKGGNMNKYKMKTPLLPTGILLCVFYYIQDSAFASELLYSLPTNPNAILRAENTDVAVQLNVSSPDQVPLETEVAFPLPNGKVVSGIMVRTIEGNAPTALGENASSVTVIAIQDNAGSLELIEHDGIITGMLLFDTANRKVYATEIDSTGSGVMKEDDPNKYLCVDYPKLVDKNLAELTLKDVQLAVFPSASDIAKLESKPGASKTLYINYWGGVLSGTRWNDFYNSGNDITYTPYSSDADTAIFSDIDLWNMWLAWEEAVEDYAPFDINVTANPAVYNAAPIANRVQIIATTTKSWYPVSSGGAAYTGIFDTTTDYYRTGWAWNSSAGSLGMTISHEAGHQMGLSHDGTSLLGYYKGHGQWGPIMGTPFNKPYIQWSKGEYPDANNQEDDIAIITNVLGTSVDDAGDSLATAKALALPATEYRGIISPDGTRPDIDVYSFYAAGLSYIEVVPSIAYYANQAANLAMNVSLKNFVGSVIASMTSGDIAPLSPGGNTFVYQGNLPAGTYYLAIEAVSPDTNWSTGFGEYGNGGEYSITIRGGGTFSGWTASARS